MFPTPPQTLEASLTSTQTLKPTDLLERESGVLQPPGSVGTSEVTLK